MGAARHRNGSHVCATACGEPLILGRTPAFRSMLQASDGD
jgi:hypothetical protein